jgi:hypothetical protein
MGDDGHRPALCQAAGHGRLVEGDRLAGIGAGGYRPRTRIDDECPQADFAVERAHLRPMHCRGLAILVRCDAGENIGLTFHGVIVELLVGKVRAPDDVLDDFTIDLAAKRNLTPFPGRIAGRPVGVDPKPDSLTLQTAIAVPEAIGGNRQSGLAIQRKTTP